MIDVIEILQHLHGTVPTVGSSIPLLDDGALTLADNGFKIDFDDTRYVLVYESRGAIFFNGRLGDPSEQRFYTYTVQLHGDRTSQLYRDVVDHLLAA